jgi:hypothetical protein
MKIFAKVRPSGSPMPKPTIWLKNLPVNMRNESRTDNLKRDLKNLRFKPLQDH